jgi:hypothetical protein
MPAANFAEDAAHALGRLLQVYGEPVGVTARRRIESIRRDRLRDGLGEWGTSVSAHTAGVLSDAIAGGRLAITETYLAISNDGDTGVAARCRCKRGSGKCQEVIEKSKAHCVEPYGSKCKDCSWRLGVAIANTARSPSSRPEQLGAQFIQQQPRAVTNAINELAALSYPVVDRVNLREQRDAEAPAVNPGKAGGSRAPSQANEASSAQQGARASAHASRIVMQLPFPLFTLTDALDKLFGCVGEQPWPTNQLRLAVGDYPTWLTRNLANAIDAGAVTVDGDTRRVTVMTRSKDGDGSIDVNCYCLFGSGECPIQYTEETLSCGQAPLGCFLCYMQVKLPAPKLQGLTSQFDLD